VQELEALGKTSGFTPLRKALKTGFATLNRIYEADGALLGVTSGYSEIDELTAGWQPGQLIVLAARPAMGKTSLGMNFAENAAVGAGIRTAVFSLEMSTEELTLRLLCGRAGCNWQVLRTGKIDAADWQALAAAGGVLGQAPLDIYDSSEVALPAMMSAIRRAHASAPLGLVVVDYLQLMSSGRGRRGNDQEETAAISRGLKMIARELKLPVIALSQLNRKLEDRSDKRPMLSDLRASGAIEQDADVVLFIYRDEVYQQSDFNSRGKAEIIIAKNRSGPLGMVEMSFIKERTRFEQLSHQHRELAQDNLPPGDRQ
jgi:replicative DNA helicase